jgi:DNA ligase 1
VFDFSFISTMLLHKVDKPVDDANFITELKLDGIHLFHNVDSAGRVRMYSWDNNEITANFPELNSIGLPPGKKLFGY